MFNKLFLLFLLMCNTAMAYSVADNYWQTYGPAKIIPHEKHYPNLNPVLEKQDKASPANLLVLVTSTQPQKVQAVKTLFAEHPKFKDTKIKVEGIRAASDIAPQPLGIENAERGAKNRIVNLKKNHPEKVQLADYIVSIENFFTSPEVYEPRDHAFVLIMDKSNRIYRYVSDGVEVHPEFYDLALDNKGMRKDGTGANQTIGEVLAETYGVDPHNWHYFVTQHKFDRKDQILSAFRDVALF